MAEKEIKSPMTVNIVYEKVIKNLHDFVGKNGKKLYWVIEDALTEYFEKREV